MTMPRNFYAVILAGGGGTRLWPVSRKRVPKQVIPILSGRGGETLLKQTWQRLRLGFAPRQIFVVTGASHEHLVRQELPDMLKNNWVFEPEKRNTGVALAVAALKISKRNPSAVLVNVNSDAYVKDRREYGRILRVAYSVVLKHPASLVLVGVKPAYPEVGYGYIKVGAQALKLKRTGGKTDQIFFVDRFVEKPDLETAKQFVSSWQYLWNPTLLVCRAATFLAQVRRYQPKLYNDLKPIRNSLENGLERPALQKAYLRMKPVNLDKGILERAKGMLVVPANFGWSDVGHWRTVKDLLARHPSAHVVKGKYRHIDSRGNLVYSLSNRVVATIGVSNHIIVDTPDALLICPKDRANEVRDVVDRIEEKYR